MCLQGFQVIFLYISVHFNSLEKGQPLLGYKCNRFPELILLHKCNSYHTVLISLVTFYSYFRICKVPSLCKHHVHAPNSYE